MTGRRLFILLYYIFRVLLSTLRFFHKFSPFSLAKPRGAAYNLFYENSSAAASRMERKKTLCMTI